MRGILRLQSDLTPFLMKPEALDETACTASEAWAHTLSDYVKFTGIVMNGRKLPP